MHKITISTSTFGEYDNNPLEMCETAGFKVVTNPFGRKVTICELCDLANDSIGLIAGTETISEEVMMQLPRLKVISRCGVGMDNVDLKAAESRNILVFNTPDGPTHAVAELTVGLMLDLLRHISKVNAEVHAGIWSKKMGNLLHRKRVGLIGYGRIGKNVASLIKAFQCEIAYTDPNVHGHSDEFKKKELDELLGWSDIVSLHVPINHQIIGERELELMKAGSWIVNVSRGGVINEEAIRNALKNGHLAGVATDVYNEEPYKGPLQDCENIILTPHIGSYARESRIQMEIDSAKNLMRGLGVNC